MKGYFRTLQAPTAVQSLCCASLTPDLPSLLLVSGPHLKQYTRSDNSLSLTRDLTLFGNLLYITNYFTQKNHGDAVLVVAEPYYVGFLMATETGVATLAQMEMPHKHRMRAEIPRFDFWQEIDTLAVHLHTERVQLITVSHSSVTPDILRLNEHHLVDHYISALCLISHNQFAVVSKAHKECLISVFDFEAEVMQTLKRWKGWGEGEIRRGPQGVWLAIADGDVHVFSRDNTLLETVKLPFPGISAISHLEADYLLLSTTTSELIAMQVAPGLPFRRLVASAPLANCIVRLDPEFVFLGAAEGSSYLYRVPIGGEAGAKVWEMTSIAPVIALQMHSHEGTYYNVIAANRMEASSEVFTCKWGSKLTPEAEFEVGRAVGLWSLRDCPNPGDTLLVLSFVDQTRTVVVLETSVEEVHLGALDYDAQTILAARWGDTIVQVTKREVRCVKDWERTGVLESQGDVLLSCTCAGRLYTLSSLRTLCLYSLLPETSLRCSVQFDYELSCIACTESYLALASFEGQFIMFADPIALTPLWRETIGINSTPRCLLFSNFTTDTVYLLCGLGDGYLLTYAVSPQEISKKSLLYVGNFISSAVPFDCKGQSCVLVVSDRPMVVYIRDNVLRQSYIGSEEMRLAVSFAHPYIGSGLAALSKSGLSLVSVSEIVDMELSVEKKPVEIVRILTVACGKVYMITAHEGVHRAKAYALPPGDEVWEQVLPSQLEPVCMIPMLDCLILCSAKPKNQGDIAVLWPFAGVKKPYRAQTFYQPPVAVGKLNSENVVVAFQQGISVWSLTKKGTLDLACMSAASSGLNGCMDVEFNLIAVGDLIRGVAIYIYTPEGIEQVGKSLPVSNIVTLKFHSPCEILISDQSRNLFLLGFIDQEHEKQIRVIGAVHFGDMVTCMQTMPIAGSSDRETGANTLLSSVLGGVYIYKTISEEDWNTLHHISAYLQSSPISFLKYPEFRYSDGFSYSPDSLIDGDLLMRFLNCTKAQQFDIAKSLSAATETDISVEEIQILITKLAYNY